MDNSQTSHKFIFSFQPLPSRYEIAKNKIPDDLIKIYSDINIKYIKFPTSINEMEGKAIELFLFNQIKDFKFMVYEISKSDSDQSFNIIICAEDHCFIIESFDSNLDFLKNSKAFLINSRENCTASEESKSFCMNYYSKINSNIFVKLTIRPIITYLIRRFFCPSEFFKDQSFFTFCEQNRVFEEKYKTKIDEFILKNNEKDFDKFKDSFLSFSNQIIEEMKNDKKDEKNQIFEFKENEFIKLRTIANCEHSLINLVIHIKELHLFIYKEIKDPNNQELYKNTQHEIDFCSKYSHRCLTRFYGFVKKKGIIYGEIYEFMSNGNLNIFIQTNETNDFFNLIAINRIFQGIEYLHSNSLIHRDLRPFNVLVNRDNTPYIADYDTVRMLNPNSTNEMTNNIGENSYASPEQHIEGANVSFPTDIYSFGQIIYYLYEKEDSYHDNNFDTVIKRKKNEDIPEMKNASEDIQSFVKNCLSFEPEKRPKLDEIKFFIAEQLNRKLLESFNERKTKEYLQFYYEYIFFKSNCLKGFLNNARDLYAKENYSEAKRYFDLLVEFKVPEAYFYMARFYQYGFSIPTDLSKAIEYFQMGSEYDDYKSSFILAQFYINGTHFEQNIPKAIEYFKKSGKYFDDANYILGGIYLDVYEDIEEGRKYLLKAAEKNHPMAISSLGELSLLDKDYKTAIQYFEKASDLNEPSSQFSLGLLYFYGTGVTQNYAKAREYFEKAAKEKDGGSYLYLGIIYENGFGLPKDFWRAKYNYDKAIEFGRVDAYCNLGVLFYNGNNTEGRNFIKAKEYFELAAKQQNPEGLLKLGLLYYEGEGVEKDYSKAKEYFELSAKLENSFALIRLGLIYLLGKGIEPDYQKALEYFQIAADKQNVQAFYYLGFIFENGLGVKSDIKKAIEFYQSAAIHENSVKLYDPGQIFVIDLDENNLFYYPSSNNLGLIYITEFCYENRDSAEKCISNAGMNEYSFGQNTFGLFNQFFLKDINNALYFYDKASTKYSFALSEYNLGYIQEYINSDIEKAIHHYEKALEFINLPLIFRGDVIDDIRLHYSKCFIACFIYLKLAYFSLSKDESQFNYDAKKYFINAIFHILFTYLLDDKGDSYEFVFKKLNNENGSALNLKDFFFNFPLFKHSNRINKSSSDWKIFEINSSEKSRFRVIVIRYQSQNGHENLLNNLIKEDEIIKVISKKIDVKLTKDNNQSDPYDLPENEPEEIQENTVDDLDLNKIIETIFNEMNNQKFFLLMKNQSEASYNDPRLEGTDSYLIRIKSLENRIERYLKYPKCLFQIFFDDLHYLKSEINDIINIMNNILYTPPYSILFGRIKTNENEENKELVI
ncbi:spindle assembly checkpoint kinase [Tritrichomonas musculus]|uniref:Spindle assembly checkpoint kinase n=1 Tax=Tritrichomonas musculus TaxID=1915356 RepID=A0ABR2K6Q1_9EUKA